LDYGQIPLLYFFYNNKMAKSTGKLLLIKVLQEEISENTLYIVVCLEHMLFKKLLLNGKLFKLPASPIHCIVRFNAALCQMTTA